MSAQSKDQVVISVDKLSKAFKISVSKGGLKGRLKSIFSPEKKTVNAVDNISFKVGAGELVAFIGPNGAGKSTTLKMLSGILFPDSGSISVMGLDPQKERKRLAYKIGTVFGQKPQLWFHLPAIDSFDLFSKIYDIDKDEYRKRLKHLVEEFDIGDIIHQPVRKLSLGQRMRCEFVLALLHNPKVLFLDEPTIGLDIIVKKNVRELIRKMNHDEGVTVILTSHDMGDVESICKRMIVINEGKIIYDGTVDDIRKRYLSYKVLEVVSDSPVEIPRIAGVTVVKKRRFAASLKVDTSKVHVKTVMDALLKANQVNDMTIGEPPIEEIIERIYKQKHV